MKDDENRGGEPAADAAAQACAPTVQLANGPVDEYLAGVRSALSDLPAPEVAEILDDVRAHLADLIDEIGGSTEPADLAALTARLGTPAAYAAELRAAAGYPVVPQGRERSGHGLARLALLGLIGSTLLAAYGAAVPAVREPGVVLFGVLLILVALPVLGRDGPRVPRVAALPEVRRVVAFRPAEGSAARRVTDFLASLQPAWWLARAFAAAVLGLAVLGAGDIEAAVLLALVVAPLSVWLGHFTRRDRRLLWAVVPFNGLAAVLLLTVLMGQVPAALGSPGSVSYAPSSQPGLWQDSERQIRDIRPVDAAGNPLTGVYLFDQDGQPINASGGSACDHRHTPMNGPGSTVHGTSDPDRPYPRGTLDFDPRTGACVLTPPRPLVVAVPSAPPATPTASAAPGSIPAPDTPSAGPVPTPAPAPPAPSAPTAPPLAPPTG
ncbi:HAAS signaling domain-containing protein [Pseudonocardia sp. H11422]|uniref:HAAS signaling domain-containing protein n=1 Tax=Pseudonocardia sp. H11422 TaxID=2835866 RepID=UPI001BDBEDD8|nr:hypothetical protein [Pseudonocardia sp. H11422]